MPEMRKCGILLMLIMLTGGARAAGTSPRGSIARGQGAAQAQKAAPPAPETAAETAPAQQSSGQDAQPAAGRDAPAKDAQPAAAANSARAAKASKILFATGAKMTASKAQSIEDDPCKVEYWACMDQFCLMDNGNGARCACSNDSIKLDKEYNALAAGLENELNAIAAAEDDIENDGDGIRSALAFIEEESEMECDDDDIACKVGAMRQSAAAKLCEPLASEECRKNIAFNKLQYSQNIRNDCAGYVLAIKDLKEKGAAALIKQRQALRDQAAEKLSDKNKFDAGECVLELKKCMSGPDVCGTDWTRCLAGAEDKRFHCEKKVLDFCDSVREEVWEGFAALIAPALKAAAIEKENGTRQNCLSEISDCVVRACRDDIEGKGVATMDSCLSRPEMAQSFCAVEMGRCGIDETGPMWAFVRQKLAAMRVDRCTEEVKECFADEGRCGPDFTKCIGLDFVAMHKMCPVDKLVVCKQDKADFSLADIDGMIMGLWLGMDNRLADKCREIADEKMEEACGDTSNCDQQFKDDNKSRFSGNVSWGAVRVSDGSSWAECKGKNPLDSCVEYPQAGILMADEYVKKFGAGLSKTERDLILADINAANQKIAVAIAQIENDGRVSWCAGGRDLSQATGDGRTIARFPTMTQGYRMIIAMSGLAAFGK
jgi:hypothetical protein